MKVSNLKQRLIKKAKTSTCKYRVAAIGLNARGVAIASAVNTTRFDRKGGSVHAEMKVMKSTPKSLSTIIIIRLGATDDLLPIDPCYACWVKAQELGVTIRSVEREHSFDDFP